MTLERNGDLSNELIVGAEVLAAGRTLGLSDDETIETKSATLRRQQRERRAQRGQREGNRAAAEEFLRQQDASFQTKGGNRRTDQVIERVRVDEDYPDPFGSFTERIYDDEGFLIETRDAGEDFQTYDDEERERMGLAVDEAEYDDRGRRIAPDDLLQERGSRVLLGKPGNQKEFWREGRKIAATGTPEAVGRDQRPAKPRLYMNPQNANASRRPDYAKGSMRYLPVAPNPNAGDEAIASVAADRKKSARMAREDRLRQNPAAVARNEAKVEAEAQEAAKRFTLGGGGAMADEDIGRINEIQALGTASAAGHGNQMDFRVTQAVDPNTFGMASPFLRDGVIEAYYGEQDGDIIQLGEVNSATTDNALNAPKYTRGQEFIVGNLPASGRPGGTSFGYPSNISVGEQLALFGERMRGLTEYGTEAFADPRSLPEFEAAIESVLARGKKVGDTFYRKDPSSGKAAVVAEPGIEDVLYKLRYTENEKQALAAALLQLDVGQRQDVNLDLKSNFASRSGIANDPRIVRGWDPEGVLTPLEKIKNEKVGRGKKRQGVGPALRAISEDSPGSLRSVLEERGELYVPEMTVSTGGEVVPTGRQVLSPIAARDLAAAAGAREDARRPFQAAPAGEPPERARFIRGKDVGKTEEQLMEQYGGKQGQVAAEIQRRALEDEAIRAEGPKPDTFAAEQRALDEEIRQRSRRNEYEDEAREIIKLEQLQREGKLRVPADSEFPGGRIPLKFRSNKQREVVQTISAAPRQAPGAWMGGSAKGRVVNPWDSQQPTREAVVAPSIAPDPWASTGPQTQTIATEAGGGGAGQPPRRPPALPYGFSEGPEEGPKRAPQQGPTMGTGPRTEQQNKDRRANQGRRFKEAARSFAQDPKYTRGRRIAYGVGGGAAALATILNLTDDEEQN